VTTTDSYGQAGQPTTTAAFWEFLRTGSFRVQRCRNCGEHRFPPNGTCPACHSPAFDWVITAGDAEVYSYTVVHRAPSPEWVERVPYYLVIGRLAEGPHLLAHLRGAPNSQVAIGTPLKLVIDQAVDARLGYHFELTRRVAQRIASTFAGEATPPGTRNGADITHTS
jgi:uncharacterized OB-fold protein